MLDFAVELATTPFLGHATSHWELYNDDSGGDENIIKAIDLSSKTTSLQVHHAFLYLYLLSLHDYEVKKPIFTFYGGRKQATMNFYFSF